MGKKPPMIFHNLPPELLTILTKYNAQPRLVAHLTIVHDVAIALSTQLNTHWPLLKYEQEAVAIGAATHDIGKAIYKNELTGPGNMHEEIGHQLLMESGLSEAHARFARTHARWKQEPDAQLEDLLVAFADKIWKGTRDETLEEAIAQRIAQQCQEENWQVYMQLDDIACELARDAHERILWQGKHAI